MDNPLGDFDPNYPGFENYAGIAPFHTYHNSQGMQSMFPHGVGNMTSGGNYDMNFYAEPAATTQSAR